MRSLLAMAVVVVVVVGPAAAVPSPSPAAEAAPAPAPAPVAEPCCGRRAAGGLFVGGFVVGGGRFGRRHHHHHGGGGCGCGGGWCGGCGRRRRSLEEVMGKEKLEDVYWQIASKDKDQCGLRLVCELAQKDQRDLTESEVTILLPFWGREESDEQSFYGRYDKAVWHGQRGSPCKELFPLCPYSAAFIMTDFSPDATSLVL